MHFTYGMRCSWRVGPNRVLVGKIVDLYDGGACLLSRDATYFVPFEALSAVYDAEWSVHTPLKLIS